MSRLRSRGAGAEMSTYVRPWRTGSDLATLNTFSVQNCGASNVKTDIYALIYKYFFYEKLIENSVIQRSVCAV